MFEADSNKPLIESLGVAPAGKDIRTIATGLNPVTLLTVGERDLKLRNGWTVFFDKVPLKPYATFLAKLGERQFTVSSQGARTTVSVGKLSAGNFRGEQQFTFYRNSPLILAEAVMSTEEDARAILYDAGLTSGAPDWQAMAWRDTSGAVQREDLQAGKDAEAVSVSGRTIVASGAGGSIAVFPPPHRYFYPLDEAYNLKFVWHGTNYGERVTDYGFGIRQEPSGDRRFVPWFNAPPGTNQELGVFYLLSSGDAEATIDQVAQYTHGDRFKKLPGFRTFTSHYHVEHTREFLQKQKEQKTDGVPAGLEVPGMVKTFKARGVEIVHLAEFHFGETPGATAEQRLPMLKTLHNECRRLSDDEILFLPGEEPNVHLGGHWISLFPKPVYWVLNRSAGKPFAETVEGYGTVYHVGSADDVLKLMEQENGLMWTAHARIKSSTGFPDAYNQTPFFQSPHFLGAAWKAMPADLSRPTLGWRVLDLLDDMSNWGARKQVIGEVDTFRMEPDFETYAHMNINYVRLEKRPRFDDGWHPVLDALRAGKFFTSTGEVLIPEFSVAGKRSGETLDPAAAREAVIEADLEWTFPMAFAEVVSGDGKQIFHDRIDLTETEGFGTRQLRVPLNLKDRTWVRFEAWDVAANGAFTQPVWIGDAKPAGTERSTGARFVPERQDDFAWENDLVAFRTYGPAIRPFGTPFTRGMEDSGIDCWNKRVTYPIIDQWYAGDPRGVSYHEDHGEGLDLYQVGSSRGCGGTAIWKDGRMILSGPFKSWKIISRDRDKSVFELIYDYDIAGERFTETKRITIELGSQMFHSESTFTKNSQPVPDLEVAIGITTHGGKAEPTVQRDEGWMSCWENFGDSGLGTGVVIDPARITEMRVATPVSDENHALILTRTDQDGHLEHLAGFAWTKAGTVKSREVWNAYLSDLSKTKK